MRAHSLRATLPGFLHSVLQSTVTSCVAFGARAWDTLLPRFPSYWRNVILAPTLLFLPTNSIQIPNEEQEILDTWKAIFCKVE
ncbi:unnamed protein product [Sphenostylis stenocarpa]|uniref:Uncharacterized protein n=1 Tax=Sphenostylis stenocarpa TaxID=92480 RepID=A0AA86RYX0_9FABA|nr:unnamed protein product [Sphenostylis stenocarpa]